MPALIDLSPSTDRKLNLVTKELAFQKVSATSDKIKLVISSAFLGLAGWTKGTRVHEKVIGLGKGLMITKAPIGVPHDKLIYDRAYGRRKERETQIDIRHQTRLKEAFLGASRARIEITPDYVRISPLKDVDSSTSTLKSATIEVPTTFAPDTVINVLNTIKQLEITNAEIVAQQEFWDSADGNLLKLQLRRAGYHMQELNGMLSASLTGHQQDNAGHREKVKIIEPIKATAPPLETIKESERLNAFVGLSGGVDAHLLEKEDFKVCYGLEYRVQEARDKTDKTEAYALSLAMNSSLHTLFNENLWTADLDQVGSLSKHIPHAHYSLPCTDFSNLKSKGAKAKAWKELSTTRDLFVRLLELIRIQSPLTLSVENVPNFGTSREGAIFTAALESMGYHVWQETLKAPDFGGLTLRERHFIVGSLLGEVQINKTPENAPEKRSAWEAIAYDFAEMNCVTQTSSVQKGIETKRIRPLKEGITVAPTICRSQNRGVKDMLTVLRNDDYYTPTLNQIRTLMGTPETFDMSFMTKELSVETLGQSVDGPMHTHLAKGIKSHIEKYLGNAAKALTSILVPKPEIKEAHAPQGEQMSLFA